MAIPDVDIHPVASGAAKKTVDAHSKKTQNDLNFYSGWFCPFVQRVWIALEEQGLDYQYHEINPYKKDKEYLALNPKGLVPTIVKDKSIIYESNVMLEYLDEKFGGSPRIMPASPEGKAHARIWGDHIAKRIVAGNFKLQLAQEKHEQDEAREKLLDGVHELFEQLDTSKGTYFGGSNPGYLDYLLVPFTVRWHYGMERFRDLVVPDSDASWQAFRSWRQAMESRDSVKNTMSEEKHLMVIINRYLKNEAQSEAAKATRKNEAVP